MSSIVEYSSIVSWKTDFFAYGTECYTLEFVHT